MATELADVPFSDSFSPDDESISDARPIVPTLEKPYPKAMISGLKAERVEEFKRWLDEWMLFLMSSQEEKQRVWTEEESAYNAAPESLDFEPFEGACADVVPLIAMAVDPIQARLSLAIFKQDPVTRLKALRDRFVDLIPSLEKFLEFYQKHRWRLRSVFEPRLFEFCKHGHMVFNVEYDREVAKIMTYDKTGDWNAVSRDVIRYAGPRVRGVGIGNFLFPPFYEHIQDCPIVAERLYLSYEDLKAQELSGKLINIDKIKGQTTDAKTAIETEQSSSADQNAGVFPRDMYYEVFRIACDYDINGDGIAERLLVTYHYGQHELLQLRYNWYTHQRKPYVVIPYTKVSGSINGLGIAKMTKPFQDALTSWERLARDNAYLANMRGFAVAKDAGIENRPKWFPGRIFRVNDPSKDVREIKLSDTYNSTLSERQNQIGMAEKRNGVSDYLTGRESPILGDRATATGTVALINEGTRRVEQTTENIREGMAEIDEMAFYIWHQYGLDGAEDMAFGDDKVARDVKKFFELVDAESLNGSLGISLSATDSTNNKTIQQQMRLAIMQTLMTYLERFVTSAHMALTVGQQIPQLREVIVEASKSAKQLFIDLLHAYDVPNPEKYVPDLEKILAGTAAGNGGGLGSIEGLLAAARGEPGMAVPPAGAGGPGRPMGQPASNGARFPSNIPPTRPL
jgi:hypothetical protein